MRQEFMIDRNGKTFCLYAGLLDEAHQQGLKEIRTTLLQIPTNENGNVAICQSEVQTEKGVFTGLGDASPQNVARAMVTCLIRMAETRAKARALRDAVNVGVVALEELGNEEGGAEAEAHPSPSFSGRWPGRIAQVSSSPDVFSGPTPARAPTASRPAATQPNPTERYNRPNVAPISRTGPGMTAEPGMGGAGMDSPDGITAAQRRMLEALARQAGEQIELDGLSRREASQRITELKARLSQPRAA